KSADDLLSEVQKTRDDPSAFGRIARAKSDDVQTRPNDGELGFASFDDLRARFGSEFADAAWALRPVGSISSIIETKAGFHIIKSLTLQPAAKLEFDEARDVVRERLGRDETSRRLGAFIDELKARFRVTVDDAALKGFADAVAAEAHGPK